MVTFVDTSVWFAALNTQDRHNQHAKQILSSTPTLAITDFVLVETWGLARSRVHRTAAENFWRGIRSGIASVDRVTPPDLDVAWTIGQDYPDQDFSLVDRTSFAVMERLGITRVASFDHHFAVYRYGLNRGRAFQIVR
jgi:predicted nucleic acid-binding protein